MIPSMQILLLYKIDSYGGGGCIITVHEISIIWDQNILYMKMGFLGFVFFVKSLMQHFYIIPSKKKNPSVKCKTQIVNIEDLHFQI